MTKWWLAVKAYWRYGFAALFFIGFVGVFTLFYWYDPRKIADHDTRVLLAGDTIRIENLLRMPQKNGDTILAGYKIGYSQKEIKGILESLIGPFDYSIISCEIFAGHDPRNCFNWTIKSSDITEVAVFYLKENAISFDIYHLATQKSESFHELSGAYCAIPSMFLKKERQKGQCNLGTIVFALDEAAYDQMSSVRLSDKAVDSLYLATKKYF